MVELHPEQLEALGSTVDAVMRLLESRGYTKETSSGVDVWRLGGTGNGVKAANAVAGHVAA